LTFLRNTLAEMRRCTIRGIRRVKSSRNGLKSNVGMEKVMSI
jgi:hypothetical protein